MAVLILRDLLIFLIFTGAIATIIAIKYFKPKNGGEKDDTDNKSRR
jgi:hypothetical protein